MRRAFLTRRGAVMSGLAAAACAPGTPASELILAAPAPPNDPRIAAIEQRIGGRIGFSAYDTASRSWMYHRSDERFAMCSTFKWMLAAAILKAVQEGRLSDDQQVDFSAADLLPNSPRTTENVARGWMSVGDLCAAAIEVSDNCAANLLLAQIGGPQGLTRFVSDGITRLDRTETALNENAPNDPRDTTTPNAMVGSLLWLLVQGPVLNAANRERIIAWMVASQTGMTRLRAGLPSAWRVGDKTGLSTARHNATNDVAIAFPPGKPPIVIACFLSDSTVDLDARNAAQADIARLVVEIWS
jgi:beta-lactamase class A